MSLNPEYIKGPVRSVTNHYRWTARREHRGPKATDTSEGGPFPECCTSSILGTEKPRGRVPGRGARIATLIASILADRSIR